MSITWTVTNLGENPASGRWSDAVYISPTTAWQLSNPFVGRVEFNGTLQPGQSYTQTLVANVPSLTPGAYHVLVRADIFNEVYEGPNESNNTTASGSIVNISAVPLELDVPYETTLDTGQQRLFQVDVPEGRTLRVTAVAADEQAATQLFISGGVAPTTTVFDASSGGVLGAQQIAVVPSTEPGTYYILLDGFSMPDPATPVTLVAELVPLAISDVQTDAGGASKYVTVNITGAGFSPQAIVKLTRPGFAEYEPASVQVVDATRIIAEFDLTDAPTGSTI